MSQVPKDLRSNSIAYAETVEGFNQGDRQKSIMQFIRAGGDATYDRTSQLIWNRVNPRLGKAISKSRYDDLFEDFVELGVLDIDDVKNPEDFRDTVEEALRNNTKFESFQNRNPSRFKGMVDKLAKQFLRTGRVVERAVASNVEELSELRAREVAKSFKEPRREKLVGQAKKMELFRVFDEQKGEDRIVRKNARGRWYDVRTGGFISNRLRPADVKKRLTTQFS